ncbi:MAG: Thiol-disulfide isomerase [Mucilaginibacter sp.]|nr:Thiol-disulfide isomerase [Mucilaginibacter sp.]
MKLSSNYIFFLLLVFIACKDNTKKATKVTPVKLIVSDTITINGDSKNVSTRKTTYLCYWDKYDNNILYSNDFKDTKQFTYKIPTKIPVVLRDIDVLGGVNYVLLPGDHISVSSNPQHELLKLEVPKDSIRNNELDFFCALSKDRNKFVSYQMVAAMKFKWPQNEVFEEYFINYRYDNYDFVAKYGEAKYKDELLFLSNYTKSKKISKQMQGIFTDMIFFKYTANRLKLDLTLLTKNKLADSLLERDIKLLGTTATKANYLYLEVFKHALLYYLQIRQEQKQHPINTLIKQDFTGVTRDYLLFDVVKKAIAGRTYTTAMLDSFNKDCTDQDFKTEISKNLELISPAKKTILITSTGTKITYDDLISQNKGKVIYIDFWASWCMPCIQQMPYSLKLHHDLEKYPISFVYCSMDESMSSWETKADGLGIGTENSFLVSNNFKSTLAKGFNITTIPRYIIINKAGKVVSVGGYLPNQSSTKAYLLKLIETDK